MTFHNVIILLYFNTHLARYIEVKYQINYFYMTIKCDELLCQIDNVLQKNIHVSRIRLTGGIFVLHLRFSYPHAA